MSVARPNTLRTDAPSDGQLAADLDRLWTELPRLQEFRFDEATCNRLIDHVASLRYHVHEGVRGPLLAGLVGGASCGKSTLFGSLVGRAISRIHYQPHSSLGPIIWTHWVHGARLKPPAGHQRFLPQLKPEEVGLGSQPIVGGVDRVYFAFHRDDRWQHLALLDLPDISSESARREGWLVRRILPWLDLVIWMVDPNDYLFEDLYIDLIADVAALGQRSIVVVNDIHGQVDPANAVLKERIARFQSDAAFVLEKLVCTPEQPYPIFRSQAEFLRLREYLLAFRWRRPAEPLLGRVRHDSASLVHANAEWLRLVGELAAGATRLVAQYRRRILASAPLLSVLPEALQRELERLRNRFSLIHHGKRLYQSLTSPARTARQAALRQFQLSVDDLNTEFLYRYLVGTLKEFGVDLHRQYLESRLVAYMQKSAPGGAVLGSFDPGSLDFRAPLDAVARHLFSGAQQIIDDPSLAKDKRFHFVMGTTGVALVFLVVETLLGIPGVTLVVGKGVTALAAVLSPELARFLPLDRMGQLARDARDMLAGVLDEQMRLMVEFYAAPRGLCIASNDNLLGLLESIASGGAATK